ncbi:MAG: TonB-dependent receptor [Saprospiraceae bacterium]|nr:TonB-dependent receptor [Saprospiraceae bacterium]
MNFRSLWLMALSCLLYTTLVGQQEVTISVFGKCDMCKERIEKTALKVDGVENARYDLASQELTVEATSSFDVNELHLAMTKVGHDTGALKASDKAYENLHTCCKYRDETPTGEFEKDEGENKGETVRSEEDLSPIVKGHIYELDNDGQEVPIIGANIIWEGAPGGVATRTDGSFEIGRIDLSDRLVISYVGYEPDTIDMSWRSTLNWVLSNDLVLQEVEVTHRKRSSEVSVMDPIQTLNISEDELCKAACCNLSESFETSPAVDVSFTDAVTGTRQIQMLGLAGKYVQITRELIPDIRGLASIYGLTYTPGAWIHSMQLSKGTGSVVNGHESMTGQINVELRKPRAKERLYLNLYANEGGRYEGNLFVKHKFSRRISSAILLHGSSRDRRFDRNDDGFLDSPLGRDVIAINRWKYQNKNGWQGQFGIKMSLINRSSGQVRFDPDLDKLSTEIWGSTNETRRYESWLKLGKILSDEQNRSIGFQLSGVLHDQDLTFGQRVYNANQENLYANIIFQTDVGASSDILKLGATINLDNYDEKFTQNLFFERNERIYGAYGEYTLKSDEILSVVGGLRADYHNQYGMMYSPRLHARIATSETHETVFRLIAGKGWRTANIFSENIGVLASSRDLVIIHTEEGNPYSLKPEEAWNFGANLTQTLYLGDRSGTFTVDYYYTLFNNQIVADYESLSSGDVMLTNQSDQTDGHSIQTQLDLELIRNLDVRTAYRYNYSEASFGGEVKSIPFTPFHRAFLNLAYEAPEDWHFDLTINWRGSQRIPESEWLSPEDRPLDRSPDFYTVNAQIRKIFKDNFELYIGGENLLNYTQDNPIINAETPFADDFDASLVWGPIFGRNIYAGLRYRIE